MNLLQSAAARIRRCRCSQDVIDIDFADQTGVADDRLAGHTEAQSSAGGQVFDVFCDNVFSRAQPVAHYFGTAVLRSLHQWRSITIVHIDDAHTRRGCAVRLKQLPLRSKVRFHGAVIVEMIAGKVRKYCNIVMKTIDPSLFQRV